MRGERPEPVHPVLVLTRSDVGRLLSIDDCIAAVEAAFRLLGQEAVPAPGVLGLPVAGGRFHVKAAIMPFDGRRYYAAKINGNFPGNPTSLGLPTIQGVVALFDAECGRPLAVMDSIEITIRRTAAATAVAAKYLARSNSTTLTVVGCGQQARCQAVALSKVVPIDLVFAYDTDPTRAISFTADLSGIVETHAVPDFAEATRRSDAIVTCTPSRRPFLTPAHVRPGTFIAAVGADSEDKQELDPRLLAGSRVVPDSARQAAAIGELHHALEAGLLDPTAVGDDLGRIVAGERPGRTSDGEITIFDSTGLALPDVAAACLVHQAARSDPTVQRILLSS